MAVMGRLRIFVVQEPVVAASCLIAGFGLFLPAVVRPILDSFETAKQAPQPALSDVCTFVIYLFNLSHYIDPNYLKMKYCFILIYQNNGIMPPFFY
ncbi:hypothetical protein HU200_037055 [Digitaria exilis]|uniref:Fiber protein Fb11 n=1 Tax=Digitaria exilis TaxID=1010633 RepID=A0A835BDX1_9POAL|nr:hypothetical protein HU200_037055 [Digitaria exilis]